VAATAKSVKLATSRMSGTTARGSELKSCLDGGSRRSHPKAV
jgi:hypothetical protein